MNNQEKRHEAAHLLVVPYNATRPQVDAAYEQRMRQYINIEHNNDPELNIRKATALYEAHVLMSYKPSHQWIAQLKLKTTSELTKMLQLLYLKCKILSELNGATTKWILNEIMELSHRIEKCHKTLRTLTAICSTSIGTYVISCGLAPHDSTYAFLAKACLLGATNASLLGIMYTMNKAKKLTQQTRTMIDAFKIISHHNNTTEHTK